MTQTIKKSKIMSPKWFNWLTNVVKNPLSLIVLYLMASALLAFLILFRFNVLQSIWVVRFNTITYFFTYYIIALFALMWLFLNLSSKVGKRISNKIWISGIIGTLGILGVLGCFILLDFTSSFSGLPEYLVFSTPIMLFFAVYFAKYRSERQTKRWLSPILVLTLILSLLMPLAAASFSSEQVIIRASHNDSVEQIDYVAGVVLATTTQIDIMRSNNDFEKLMLSGAGSCGEGAIAMLTFFKRMGFEARETAFPGEDHAFVEVKVDGAWQVVDPGYSPTLLTREARVERRVHEAGTISYVAAYTENGFIELTKQYVETDTIIIKVTEYGEPLADVAITLSHTLAVDGKTQSRILPGHGYSFHTDTNGTVKVNLGKICETAYTNEFAKTEPYYTICVNGKATQSTCNSTGTGIETEILIELAS